METFYVITCGDGDVSVCKYTADDLEAYLQENYLDEECEPVFLSKPNTAPSNLAGDNQQGDPNYWPEGGMLIIRGEVVLPRAAEVTTKYVVE